MKTQQGIPLPTTSIEDLVAALEQHLAAAPKRIKAKDRRLAQQLAAQQRPTANKVSKGTKRDLCTQGGRLSNRFNDSGRVRIGKEGVELLLANEKG